MPIFVKHHRFAGQREYRFVIWAAEEPSECVVDLKVSCAMLGSLEERPPEPAGLPPAPEATDYDSESAKAADVTEDPNRDAASKEPLDSTSDWFWPGLLAGGDNPTTPLSRTIDPAAYADNPRAATTAAALSALRSKVAQVRGERRMKAASSAWHHRRAGGQRDGQHRPTAWVSPACGFRQRHRVHFQRDAAMAAGPAGRVALHRSGQAHVERLGREPHRAPP